MSTASSADWPGALRSKEFSLKALKLLLGAAALLAKPAGAQMQMPGMTMPVPEKTTTKKPGAKKAGTPRAAHKVGPSPSSSMKGMTMPVAPSEPAPAGSSQMPMDHSEMDHGGMDQMNTGMAEQGGHEMMMHGALGPYPMKRESSGTAWQPDASEHLGLHVMSGDWTLMTHGVLNLVYDRQAGPRGDDKAFASGMLMGMIRHPLGDGTVQFKAMVSPDPIMGQSGYPLLLTSGETANGADRLIDRQHPHDFFMELSASVSQNIGPKSSVFLYAGLPGEPAFGPPAFMHRESIMDSPEAPITHHWLDSTHITFGVATAGLVFDRVKLEISRFNGREPDQHRWNIETGSLDSTSLRLSWNPSRTLALQGSWGRFKDPEQLEPGVDQERWSASALWADEVAPGWKAAATLAWGRRHQQGNNDDAYVAEASLKHDRWTVFGRGEMAENRELTIQIDGSPYRVGKLSLGAVRDFRMANHLSLGAGALFSVNFVPDTLAPLYGGQNRVGGMGFVRLKRD